jgi:hypothetical protein
LTGVTVLITMLDMSKFELTSGTAEEPNPPQHASLNAEPFISRDYVEPLSLPLYRWNGSSVPEPKDSHAPRERPDPLKLARYYQSFLDSGKFESGASLARYLGVSRARVTQVLGRL